MTHPSQMTGEERVRHILASCDYIGHRTGLVSTHELGRYVPPSTAPVTLAKEKRHAD